MINLLSGLQGIVVNHPIEAVLLSWVIAAVGSLITVYTATTAMESETQHCEGC